MEERSIDMGVLGRDERGELSVDILEVVGKKVEVVWNRGG
jgi:hypothetical protein